MQELFIVDAVHYLFRSYYAIGPMTDEKGESTNALFGFIRSLQKIIKDFSVKNMVAVFDGPDNKKSRQLVYAEYKMNRKGAPADLYPQFEKAFNFCVMSGIYALSIEGVEADDTIASIANWAKDNYDKVYICSNDKDLFQLISDNVFGLNTYKDNTIIDKEKVKESFGVLPEEILDFLALCGDASDNIPGIEGFGPKTAAMLLQEYHSLDNIYVNIDKLKGKKQETLLKEKDKAYLSRELATLKYDIDFAHNKEIFQIKPQDTEGLQKFYHEMKFLKFLQDLPTHKQEKEDKVEYILINDEKELKTLIHKLAKEKEIAIDTETTSLDVMTASLVGIGLCVKANLAWYIPLNGKMEELLVLRLLKDLLERDDIKFYGHNIKYDYHILKNHGIEIKNIGFDTMLASYLLSPESRRHNLDILSLDKFNKTKIPITDLIGEKQEKSMRDVSLEKITAYCCEDVDYTCRLKHLFYKELEKANLLSVLENIELPLIVVLVEMERNGIFLDEEKLLEIKKDLEKLLTHVEAKILKEAGEEFNINSPKQLSHILYEKLQIPPPKRATSEFSTSADVLEKLKGKFPIIDDILLYRTYQKLLSTYADSLAKDINPATKRIHCTFNQSITATGRLSCQDPNLQNIPVRTEEGRKIREAFRPQYRGWSFLAADYSQIELRLVAHFSEDENMLRAFHNNEDIHRATASLVFNIPLKDVSQEMRQAAKAVNFGIIYGQGPYGLSQQLGISTKEAEKFINDYFEKYSKVKDFLERCKKEAEEKEEAVTLFGRKRPLLEIASKNPSLKALGMRLAINTPLQGTAADLIKLAMIAVHKDIREEKLRSMMVLQIHDELIFEAPEEELLVLERIVKERMEKVVHLKVPLIVDIAIGKNWGQC
jgi:DNA polymerase-1